MEGRVKAVCLLCRGRARTPATSKMEFFITIINSFVSAPSTFIKFCDSQFSSSLKLKCISWWSPCLSWWVIFVTVRKKGMPSFVLCHKSDPWTYRENADVFSGFKKENIAKEMGCVNSVSSLLLSLSLYNNVGLRWSWVWLLLRL